jgi:two-component system nitrogen regulation response regulator GlnG
VARILLIEDDAEVRSVIAEALGESGHQVTSAATFRQGIDHLRSGAWDLLLSNAVLSGGRTGLDLAREAVARDIAALLIVDDQPSATELQAAGVHMLRKPFRLHALRTAVAAAMRRSGG